MSRKSLAAPVRPPAPPRLAERAATVGRCLTAIRGRVEQLRERTDKLGTRDRIECRSLLQSLELRLADLALDLERLSRDVPAPDRRWLRLETSCNEVAEHLGFLAQIICGRIHESPRRERR